MMEPPLPDDEAFLAAMDLLARMEANLAHLRRVWPRLEELVTLERHARYYRELRMPTSALTPLVLSRRLPPQGRLLAGEALDAVMDAVLTATLDDEPYD